MWNAKARTLRTRDATMEPVSEKLPGAVARSSKIRAAFGWPSYLVRLGLLVLLPGESGHDISMHGINLRFDRVLGLAVLNRLHHLHGLRGDPHEHGRARVAEGFDLVRQ